MKNCIGRVDRKSFGANRNEKMNMYYLVSDYSVPVYIDYQGTFHINNLVSFNEKRRYYIKQGRNLPSNYTIAILDNHTQVRVVFYNVDNGLFLIKAGNQRTAYEVFRALDGFFFLFKGGAPNYDRCIPKLTEICKVPHYDWDIDRLFKELSQRNMEIMQTDVYNLRSSPFIQAYEMQLLGPYVERIYSDRRFNEALHHLGHSRFLYYGFMVGSYYNCHYRHDRQNMSKHLIQKQYYENRERFELAFLSAFRGIERFLNVNQIKDPDIDRSLVKLQIANIKPDTNYHRRHEIFSGRRRDVTYRDIISQFLKIRNTVAAHANPSPPSDFIISEDSVMEIQLFLSELCSKGLGQIQPRQLPTGAILPLYKKKHSV